MVYTKTGPFVANTAPAISPTFLNNLETAAADATEILMPPPTGNDDSAALSAAYATAASTGGTLQLRSGTYIGNVLGPVSASQATVQGRGLTQTIIQAASNSSPVFKIRGGSGPVNGGGLRSLGLKGAAGGGGVGLEHAGVTTFRSRDVQVFAPSGQTLDVGVRFHNETSGSFTEFCTFEGTISQSVTPVRYSVTSGNESFHGSGIVGQSIINTVPASTYPVVLIDSGIALPYNAPASFDVFPTNNNQVIFSNGNTVAGRNASFYGTLRVENATGIQIVAASGANPVYYIGGIIGFGYNYGGLGKLFLADEVNYDGNNNVVLARLRPINTYNTLASGTTTLTSGAPYGGGMGRATVTIIGSNYYQAYVMDIWQSNTSSGGSVKNVTQMQGVDSAGIGAPTFAWGNYGLQVTNNNYSSSFTAFTSLSVSDFGVYGRSAFTQ